MLANSKPLSLFKEGFRNRISIASFMRRLNVLLSVARTFVILFNSSRLDNANPRGRRLLFLAPHAREPSLSPHPAPATQGSRLGKHS